MASRATGSKGSAGSPRSIVSTTPAVTRAPSQSWAPTVMSGPSPVGTWAMKSARRSSKFFCTRVTFAPVSVSNFFAAAVMASSRSASVQMTSSAPDPSVDSSLGVAEQPASTMAETAATAPSPSSLVRMVCFLSEVTPDPGGSGGDSGGASQGFARDAHDGDGAAGEFEGALDGRVGEQLVAGDGELCRGAAVVDGDE